MALVECPECNNSVSESALSCPRCGARLNFKMHRIKNIVDTYWEEIKKPNNVTQSNGEKRSNFTVIDRIKFRLVIGYVFVGVVISIMMWACNNYVLHVPEILSVMFMELQSPGKYLCDLFVVYASGIDFNWAVDALEWTKYIEILINGIMFSCVIYIIGLVIKEIRKWLPRLYFMVKKLNY